MPLFSALEAHGMAAVRTVQLASVQACRLHHSFTARLNTEANHRITLLQVLALEPLILFEDLWIRLSYQLPNGPLIQHLPAGAIKALDLVQLVLLDTHDDLLPAAL